MEDKKKLILDIFDYDGNDDYNEDFPVIVYLKSKDIIICKDLDTYWYELEENEELNKNNQEIEVRSMNGSLIHREDGPAVIFFYGLCKHYYINGKLHRDDGPAVIGQYKDIFYIDGFDLTKWLEENNVDPSTQEGKLALKMKWGIDLTKKKNNNKNDNVIQIQSLSQLIIK